MVGAAAASHSHNYAGADSAGGATKEVKSWGKATENVARHVWFSNNGADNQRVYNDSFKYNPVENVVSCNISGTANVANYLNGTARCVTQSSAAKPYWRCLKLESNTNWLDSSVVLCVDSGYENGGFGILAVRFRNDNLACIMICLSKNILTYRYYIHIYSRFMNLLENKLIWCRIYLIGKTKK